MCNTKLHLQPLLHDIFHFICSFLWPHLCRDCQLGFMPESRCVFDRGLGMDKDKTFVFYSSINNLLKWVATFSHGSSAEQHVACWCVLSIKL